MRRRNHYVGIKPDGEIQHFEVSSKDLYDVIVSFVGSPFDNAVIGGYEQDGKRKIVDAYLHDEGLFNGMEPNWPLMAATGAPICGPVLLCGGIDQHGNSLPPWDSPILKVLEDIAGLIKTGRDQIQHNREHPFTIMTMDEFMGMEAADEHDG